MRSLLVVCVLMALVALTPAPGAPGSASAETISIVASANAWVKKDAPTTNQSEAETLLVQSNGTASASSFTYLRFDLSPLADLATITSASLDMYWTSAGSANAVSVCALNDLANAGLGKTETSWSGNLTWNTRPDGTANLPNTNYTSGLLASAVRATGLPRTVSFDLTSALPDLLAGDTNHQLTLILYKSANEDNSFASLGNTGGNPVPTLRVEYSNPIPEPGTLALLGMALLGLGWYGWRKRGVRG